MTDPDSARPGVEPRDLLALYTLAVEMADRVSARRATANSFFFTVQAGLAVALGAFAINVDESAQEPDRFVLFLAALAGAVISSSWWLLLRSYRDLNKAKFEVILRIERQHMDLQLFSEEWTELKKDPIKRWRPRYSEQGAAERIVPGVFLLLYAVLAVYVLAG